MLYGSWRIRGQTACIIEGINSIIIHALISVHRSWFFLGFATCVIATFMESSHFFLWKMYIFPLEYVFYICLLQWHRFLSSVIDTVLHSVGIQYLLKFMKAKMSIKKSSEKTMICSLIYRKQLYQTIIMLRNNNTWAHPRPH